MSITTHHNSAVIHEQIRSLYQKSPFLYLGIIIVMAIVGGFFWDRVDKTLLVGWMASIILLTLLRILLVFRYWRIRPPRHASMKWGAAFAFSSLISGLLWGSITPLFLQPDEFEAVLLVAVVLTGMCGGSLIPLSAFIPAYFSFCLPAMLPLAIIMFVDGDASIVLISYLVVTFILVMLGYSFVVNRNLADSIRLRFENLDLLEDLRHQKDIAEKANADKSRFLAAASHDLRQPLHAMDLYLGALENVLTESEQKQLLSKSRRSSKVLRELFEALMDISRLDSGSIVVNPGFVDIRQSLQELVDEFDKLASQKQIEVRMRCPLLVIYSDKVLLGRMLRNLLSNALSHSNASKILLTARRVAGKVRIEIRDNGCGIPVTEQEQVFSEFYQLNNPERDRGKGLGLGLAIVKRLANLLKLELQLFSEVEQGSCFRITAPEVEAIKTDQSPVIPDLEKDISGLFVFFIEDEASVREAMSILLRQWGCRLLAADSLDGIYRELDKLDYPIPDLLISDYRLRDNQNGLDAIKALRQRFTFLIPAIVVTGDTDQGIYDEALRQQCSVLYKPVFPADLRRAIDDCRLTRKI